MYNIRMNFDEDTLRQVIYGYKLIKAAYEKVPNITINKESVKISYQYSGWLTKLSAEIFNFLIKEEKDIVKSAEVYEIRQAMWQLDYEEYHKDMCFDSYLEYALEDEYYLACGGCRECPVCNEIFDEYLEGISLCEKRIKMKELIDVSKIDVFYLDYIPNILNNHFVKDNVVIDVDISESTNEVIIKYLDDESGYFSMLRNDDMENYETILEIINNVGGRKEYV